MRKIVYLLLFLSSVVMLRPASEAEPATVATQGEVELPESYYVALTFDDGPHDGTTERLLDGLRQRGASATFFLLGREAEAHPELVLRIAAEGHQIGNHTWSHVRLAGEETQVFDAEVNRTETVLQSLLGGSGYWIRVPYGLVDEAMLLQAKVPLVKWSIDSRDWESRDKDAVVKEVSELMAPNAIILMHDIYETTVDAALELIDRYQQQGYRFVTVEELLRLNGVEPRGGALYRSGEGESPFIW